MECCIVGCLSDEMTVNADIVRQLFAQPAELLSHGGDFTGKPDMQIHADRTWVLKINPRRNFTSQVVAEQ